MEIYTGLKVNDEITLGDMLAIKKEFGKEIHELDWNNLDSELSIGVIKTLVQSASPTPIDNLDFKVGQIPFAKMTDAMGKIADMLKTKGSGKKAKAGNLQEQAKK